MEQPQLKTITENGARTIREKIGQSLILGGSVGTLALGAVAIVAPIITGETELTEKALAGSLSSFAVIGAGAVLRND